MRNLRQLLSYDYTKMECEATAVTERRFFTSVLQIAFSYSHSIVLGGLDEMS